MAAVNRPRVANSALARLATMTALVAVASVQCRAVALAQTPSSQNGNRTSAIAWWASAWSPLAPLGDLPRSLPGTQPFLPSLLIRPAPRVGSFWTAGTPGPLATQVRDERAQFEFDLTDVSGTYRRPLDSGAGSRWSGRGFGWGKMGPNGAGIGHIVLQRARLDDGVHGSIVQPYASEPYAVVDTIGEAMSGTTVLLEGAGGWQLGRIGFGVGLGYESLDERSVASAAPRTHRKATPGVTAGIDYALRRVGLHLGAFGRWQQTSETMSVYSINTSTRLYRLAGYHEPVPINITNNYYRRRFNRKAWALGVTVGGRTGAVDWAAFAQSENLSAVNYTTTVGEAPEDRWESGGWSGGGGGQFTIGKSLLATANAKVTMLSGNAKQHEISGTPFRANEMRAELNAELRLVPISGWEAAVSLGVVREERERIDGLAEVSSDIRVWRPSTSFELARWLGSSFAVSVGGAFMQHNPAALLPLASAMGPVYQNWVAPELELEATAAQGKMGMVTLRWQPTPATGVWVRALYEQAQPSRQSLGKLPHGPEGDRTGWSIRLGVVMGGGRAGAS